MKFAAVLALATYASATPMGEFEHEFFKFLAQHNRRYATKEEYNLRYQEFEKNYKFITQYASETQTVGVNHMADWTREEYRQLLGYRQVNTNETKIFENNETNAESVDWRAKGAVTHVKNQGQCGSCWTFSTTGAIEGRHQQVKGVLTSFSEQQLVDCCNNNVGGCMYSQGCNGGSMDEGLTYTQTYDLMTEADYPYTAQDGSCTYPGAGHGAGYTNKSKSDIAANKTAFKASVATGPTSIAIEADQMAFQFYSGGILDSGCGQQLDHGVLAVGYGVENGTTYAIVKNSWGGSWGENGYIKISLDNNSCGILNQPVRPN